MTIIYVPGRRPCLFKCDSVNAWHAVLLTAMKSTAMLSAAMDSRAGSRSTASASLRKPCASDAAALLAPSDLVPEVDCFRAPDDRHTQIRPGVVWDHDWLGKYNLTQTLQPQPQPLGPENPDLHCWPISSVTQDLCRE